jgi:hypothetical protein
MNCMHAQQLLSEAMDDRSIDTTLLAEAREHCASCAECAAFAHGLALLERAETPDPGPALADAVVAAIRASASESPTADATASDSGESAATRATAATTDLEAGSGAPSADSTRSSRRTPDASTGASAKRRYWNTLSWVGAAAAVLIVAGFATVAGVRSILAPTPSSQESASVAQDTGTSPGYDDSLAATTPKAAGQAPAAPALSSPGFITMDGAAYRYVGIADIERSTLTTVGSTTTALDTGGAARTYTIYSTGTAGRVAVLSAEGTRVFELVTRRLNSRVYVLTSEAIADFTVWPGLPPNFPQPTTADGAPTFVAAGTDDLGINAFSKPGTPIETGFAIAPATPMSDPAMGNPNWTWWAIAP